MANLLLDQLISDGFVVIRGVLDAEKVRRLRHVCWDYYARTGNNLLFPTTFLTIPELAEIPFSRPVVEILKGLLGENYTIIPDFTVQINKFGGWHRDNNSEGRAEYLYAPDYLFVKCGIFLQDNSVERGGGIDIVPGGHRLRIGAPQSFLSRSLRRAYFELHKAVSVESKAGDLICFDSRMYHQSTRPTKLLPKGYSTKTEYLSIPEQSAKLAIYWNASRTDGYVKHFVANGVKRREADPHYGDTWSVKYPDNYPKDAVRAVEEYGLHIATATED